jgi:hypothetical protein
MIDLGLTNGFRGVTIGRVISQTGILSIWYFEVTKRYVYTVYVLKTTSITAKEKNTP